LFEGYDRLANFYSEINNFEKTGKYHYDELKMLEKLYPEDRFPNGSYEIVFCFESIAKLYAAWGVYDKSYIYFQKMRVMYDNLDKAKEGE
jgi:hypothetical protein